MGLIAVQTDVIVGCWRRNSLHHVAVWGRLACVPYSPALAFTLATIVCRPSPTLLARTRHLARLVNTATGDVAYAISITGVLAAAPLTYFVLYGHLITLG